MLKSSFNTIINPCMAASFWYNGSNNTYCYDFFVIYKAVFGLASNVSENRRKYLLALGSFTGTDIADEILLLPVNFSRVDTMKASRIAL